MTEADRMNHANLEHIAEVAAAKAVARTFSLLGVDVESQNELNILRDVLLHARKMQKLSERVGLLATLTIAGAVISGALAFLWQGLIEALRR